MNAMLLTPAALVQLTGLKQAKRQIAWLTKNGWKFEVNALGEPVVLAAYAEARLGGKLAVRRGPRLEGLSRHSA